MFAWMPLAASLLAGCGGGGGGAAPESSAASSPPPSNPSPVQLFVDATAASGINYEVAFTLPTAGGNLTTYHYSMSLIPDKTGYKPREADERVGYFMTVYRDLGSYIDDEKWVRYIDRWHLEKRDPKLAVSPPKEPVVFYLEHTVPVRYRRSPKQGA